MYCYSTNRIIDMKLMINGAITLGTLDGANVEIHEQVGDDNIIIFGMRTPEVLQISKQGYNPMQYYNNNADLRAALDFIGAGFGGQRFDNIYNTLKIMTKIMCFGHYSFYL